MAYFIVRRKGKGLVRNSTRASGKKLKIDKASRVVRCLVTAMWGELMGFKGPRMLVENKNVRGIINMSNTLINNLAFT
jgi:hypothetical protein